MDSQMLVLLGEVFGLKCEDVMGGSIKTYIM